MMNIRSSPENPSSGTRIEAIIPASPPSITNPTCPSWKLYENPFYNSHHHHQHQQCQSNINGASTSTSVKQLHRLHLPLSARKIAASFWDLPFIKPAMDSDQLEFARAQIAELKAELELERRIRRKAESVNKKLARDLAEERRGREAMEKVCEELAKELSLKKAQMDKVKKEMEEERRMLKVAEVLREERVQMKLADAKLFFEEKLSELESCKRCEQNNEASTSKTEERNYGLVSASIPSLSRESSMRAASMEKSDIVYSSPVQRKASPEPENPHIRRGIKGFVEFPRVVRAIGSKSRPWGTKLECQKAQLRVLLKQRSPIQSNALIIG